MGGYVWIDCGDCGGEGVTITVDVDGNDEEFKCDTCDGKGSVLVEEQYPGEYD